MRKILLFLGFAVLAFPNQAWAHGPGMPPFFLVNGKYADYYFTSAYTSGISSFTLPQDVAAENFLVNQKIDFEIDTKPIGIPEYILIKSTFSWDFGDGKKGEGLKNSHVYTKSGSFIVTINIISENQTSLLETALVNILPDKNYKLPQAMIKINGKSGVDPAKGVLDVDFSKLKFDAGSSKSSSGIQTYIWDFGDGKGGKTKNLSHSFPKEQIYSTVLLRVIDENGLFSDAITDIRDSASLTSSLSAKNDQPFIWFLRVGSLFLILPLIFFFRRKR